MVRVAGGTVKSQVSATQRRQQNKARTDMGSVSVIASTTTDAEALTGCNTGTLQVEKALRTVGFACSRGVVLAIQPQMHGIGSAMLPASRPGERSWPPAVLSQRCSVD